LKTEEGKINEIHIPIVPKTITDLGKSMIRRANEENIFSENSDEGMSQIPKFFNLSNMKQGT
jgi:hypothetical protein